MPKRKASPLLVAFITVAIDLLGFGIVLPLLGFYSANFVGGVPAKLQGATIGFLMSSFSLMQFVFAPLWGRLSDRIGRRPVLMVGLSGSAVFYALFGIATWQGSLFLVMLSRIGAGVAGATIGTAQAVIADCTPPEKRAQGMALIGMAFGIGFTLGPVIGALVAREELGHPSGAAPGFVAAGLSLAALLLAALRLPETRPAGGAVPKRKWFDLEGWKLALGYRPVAVPLLTFFIATLAFAGFEATLARFARDELGYRIWQMAWLFAYIGAVLMLTQGLIVRRIVSRVGEVRMILLGIGLMLGGLLAVASAVQAGHQSLPLILTTMALAVIGFAFLTPSAQALVSRRSSVLRQGEVLGVGQASAAIARILGPLVGNALYGGAESTTRLYPYYAGAAMLGLAFLVAMMLLKPEPASSVAGDLLSGEERPDAG